MSLLFFCRTVCGVILLLCLIGTVLDMMYDCSRDIKLLINTHNGGGFVPFGESSAEAANSFKSSSEVLIHEGDSGNQYPYNSANFHSSPTPVVMAPTVLKTKDVASKQIEL